MPSVLLIPSWLSTGAEQAVGEPALGAGVNSPYGSPSRSLGMKCQLSRSSSSNGEGRPGPLAVIERRQEVARPVDHLAGDIGRGGRPADRCRDRRNSANNRALVLVGILGPSGSDSTFGIGSLASAGRGPIPTFGNGRARAVLHGYNRQPFCLSVRSCGMGLPPSRPRPNPSEDFEPELAGTGGRHGGDHVRRPRSRPCRAPDRSGSPADGHRHHGRRKGRRADRDGQSGDPRIARGASPKRKDASRCRGIRG